MLILAGVSINAIVGDNGILTRTQYASFLNEMAAVEEAVQLWKVGETIEAQGEETKQIPANGLCKANELTETERLVGEVGYYRIWSMSETQPTTNILSDASTFNKAFESELIFYPAGVQDLYYLNNYALEIKGNKTYLIDASTGMIYSMTGIGLKGVRCYSSNMAKAVMNGDNTAPLFAEAEVSGTGMGDKLAGNVQDEFLEDGTPNPDYNPYGFKIIASSNSNNIYKLYNNGDLYGKGIKGTALNTSAEEMEKINGGIFQELTFPGEIVGMSGNVGYDIIKSNGCQIFEGGNTIFVLNAIGELWAWGSNSSNKLGLTQEQQVEYTGREAIKLNIDGKKVKKVFATDCSTFVVTDESEPKLYAAGSNTGVSAGCLGLGHSNAITSFEQVEFEYPDNIIKVETGIGNTYRTIILCDNNHIYISGHISEIFTGYGTQTKFLSIFDGTVGDNIASEIQNFFAVRGIVILTKDGTLYQQSRDGYSFANGLKHNGTLEQFPNEYSTGIKKVYHLSQYSFLIEKENGEIWFHAGRSLGILGEEIKDSITNFYEFVRINDFLNEELISNGIKQIVPCYEAGCYFIDNNNNVYASGQQLICGINTQSSTITSEIENLSEYGSNLKNYQVNNILEFTYNYFPIIETNSGKALTIRYSELIFRDNILQGSWYKMNPDGVQVKQVSLENYQTNYAFIDSNNNLWIAGNQSQWLGVNSKIEEYSNFIMHPDTSIQGKAKKIFLASGRNIFNNN